MKKKHTIEQLIISSLKNSYGIEVANIAHLALGADAEALVYKVQTPNQTTYFVKLKRGQQDISTNLQFLLHDAGIKEVICPIKMLDKQPQLYAADFILIVYPFIHGQDGFTQSLTDDQWITFGKALKHIHQLQLPTSVTQSIKQENFSPKWKNKVKSIYENIEDVIPPDEIASNFLVSLKKHKSEILCLVDKVEKLDSSIQKQSGDFVLCHGDIHAGNVLVTPNGVLYIVDWDQPIMAPKERDLMFIGAGVGNVWNNEHEIEQFYAGYGTTKIDQNIIDYYRCDRIIQDVVEYYEQLFSDTAGYKDQEIGYNNFVAMFEPNGVVNIALQTKS
jgi:spectinomycin phosphotransferase